MPTTREFLVGLGTTILFISNDKIRSLVVGSSPAKLPSLDRKVYDDISSRLSNLESNEEYMHITDRFANSSLGRAVEEEVKRTVQGLQHNRNFCAEYAANVAVGSVYWNLKEQAKEGSLEEEIFNTPDAIEKFERLDGTRRNNQSVKAYGELVSKDPLLKILLEDSRFLYEQGHPGFSVGDSSINYSRRFRGVSRSNGKLPTFETAVKNYAMEMAKLAAYALGFQAAISK